MRAPLLARRERTPGKMRVQVALEPTRALFAGAHEGARNTLDLAVQAAHGTARTSSATTRDSPSLLLSSRPPVGDLLPRLRSAPGVAQVRVVVRDEASGRVRSPLLFRSSAGRACAWPPRSWTDELRAPPCRKAPGQLLIPAPHLPHHHHRPCSHDGAGRGPIVHAGKRSQVEVSYVLRRASGTVVRQGAPSLIIPAVPEARSCAWACRLGGPADGDYDLVLRAPRPHHGQRSGARGVVPAGTQLGSSFATPSCGQARGRAPSVGLDREA